MAWFLVVLAVLAGAWALVCGLWLVTWLSAVRQWNKILDLDEPESRYALGHARARVAALEADRRYLRARLLTQGALGRVGLSGRIAETEPGMGQQTVGGDLPRRARVAPLVIGYLASVVAANVIVARYGLAVTLYTSFIFISLNFVARDRLADLWAEWRWAKMTALILGGSLLSYASVWYDSTSSQAATIAIASAIAFCTSEAVDAAVYHVIRWRPWLERTNGSNIVAAAVDSLVFPTVAFGGLVAGVSFVQFTAKLAGGVVWSLVFGGLLVINGTRSAWRVRRAGQASGQAES